MIARAVGPARQVLEQAAALDLELDVVGRVVQLLLGDRPGAVDRVEVERRRAEVARRLRFGRLAEPRVGVEGHVVVEELAEERRPRRVRRVVGVVGAQRQVDDQLPWARPRADRWRRAGRRACPARAAPPRPSGSAARTAAAGRSDRSARALGTRARAPRGARAGVAAAPPGLSAAAPALAPIAPRNRLRLSRCLSCAAIVMPRQLARGLGRRVTDRAPMKPPAPRARAAPQPISA